MSSIQTLERQVAELRALVRQRIGAPAELLVVLRGDQDEENVAREALEAVPAAWRSEVRLQWIRLPWLTGRNVHASRTGAVLTVQAIDYIGEAPAVARQDEAAPCSSRCSRPQRPSRSRPRFPPMPAIRPPTGVASGGGGGVGNGASPLPSLIPKKAQVKLTPNQGNSP